MQQNLTSLRETADCPNFILGTKVFIFEQTRHDATIHFPPEFMGSVSVTVPQNESYKDYARYAEHCLNVAHQLTDQESRRIHREMAAECLILADAIRPPLKSWETHPLKSEQVQVG